MEKSGLSDIKKEYMKSIRKQQPAVKVYFDIKKSYQNRNVWVAKEYESELGCRSLDARLLYLLKLGLIERVSPGKYTIAGQQFSE